MKTDFTQDQRSNSMILMMEKNLRKCVHCGFCLTVCPTYSVLGDERDSPRGRIYLTKDMLENDNKISSEVVAHVDRCLSCLACMTACPSGVDYQHYIDYARTYIEENYRRPIYDRSFRRIIRVILEKPGLFRFLLTLVYLIKPIMSFLDNKRFNFINLIPNKMPARVLSDRPSTYQVERKRTSRVALLPGCAQKVLRPSINEATIRLLTRMNIEVVIPEGIGCCGALAYHLGQKQASLKLAKSNIDALMNEINREAFDAIVVNAAGCGTELKDYEFLFSEDPNYKEKAREISNLTKDVTEVVSKHKLPKITVSNLPNIIYHDACSLMHGQGIVDQPREQLRKVGFRVNEIPSPHFCCGSAGSYNLLQTEMANHLKDNRVDQLAKVSQNNDVKFLVTGNIGCLIQLASGTDLPVVHTVELLDWATGGIKPEY